MKKIILMIWLFIASFWLNSCYAQTNNTWTYQMSESLKMKLDTILDRFFHKVDRKIKTIEKKIQFYERLNKKIEKIKTRKAGKKLIIAVLNYFEKRVNEQISKLKEINNSVCTMEYAPVCAIVKENTIRCITAPCPDNGVYKTFSNACMAKKAWYKIAYKWECKKQKNNTENTISPEQYQKILWIGIDVNWVNFKKEVKAYTNKWSNDFKAKWFDNVRIRFWEGVDLNHLKKVVDNSLKAWLIPVVAFAANDFKYNPDEAHLEKAVEIWKKVSETLKDEDYKVSFDLVIEPWKNLKKSPQMLYKFYEKVVPIIRNSWWKNKNRIIFLAPNHLANPEYLKDLTPTFKKLNDKYLMAEFHFLAAWPFRKTNSTWKRLTWNGTWTIEERQKIEDRVNIAYNWQNQNWIKIWFWAWMPWNYNHTNDGWNNNYSIEEQISFAKYFESVLKKYNIPNNINADQKFYDIEKNDWRTDRLKVIETIIKTWKK